MTRSAIRSLCALLALLLVSSTFACLAETERETVVSGYESLNDEQHEVYTETW